MDLKDVVQSLRSGWWLILAMSLLGTAAATAASLVATPLYSSTTQLFVSTASSDATSAAAYQGNLFSQQRVASYATLLTGQQLAGKVVEDLALPMSPAQVAAEVSATAVPETVILRVTVTDPSPRRAQAIAASLSRIFAERVAQLETPPGAKSSTVKVTVTEAAGYSNTPVSPNRVRNIELGVVVGALLGFGGALLRSRLDRSVKTSDQVVELTGVGVIGTVFEDARIAEDHLVIDGEKEPVAAEAYRSIRTNLQFTNVDDPPRVIVVSSAVVGEGKSTLAVNLASALAQFGSRVVLIEADLRRPRVTTYMGLPGGAGLSNLLIGNAALHDVLQPAGDGRLSVLAAGPMPHNPSEILGSSRMRSLLEHLRRTNDQVIIDAPPLLPVTDAAVLSVLSDGCILSTRYGHTRKEELAEAAQSLKQIDVPLLGVVLNRVPQRASGARAYGYGYEADRGRLESGVTEITASRRARRDDDPRYQNTAAVRAVR